MKRISRTVSLIGAVFCLSVSGQPGADKTTYKVSIDEEYAPYEFVALSGEVSGFTPELLAEIGKTTGASFHCVPMDWPSAVAQLDSGKVDLVSMIRTQEREAKYTFSEPHCKIRQGIFRYHLAKDIHDLASLRGHLVAFQSGDICLEKLGGRTDFRQHLVMSKSEGFLHLDAGAVDAFLTAEQAGLYLIDRYKLDNVELAVTGLFPHSYCFAARKGNRELIALVNSGLEKSRASGRYDKLAEKWLSPSRGPAMWFSRHWLALAGALIALLAMLAAFVAWAVILRWTVRKRTEALREREEKFRGIFQNSIAAIYLFDSEMRFIDANQAGLDLLGYSREELLRLRIPDVDADPEAVEPAHGQLLAGQEIANYEHQLKHKDGKIITVLNNSIPLTDEGGHVTGLQSTLVDISKRKQSEEALLRSHNELAAVFDAVNISLIILDTDLKVKQYNEAFRKELSPLVETPGGQRPGDLLHCVNASGSPEGCGFGPDCKSCVSRNTILKTIQTRVTQANIEAEITRQIGEETVVRSVYLNSAYFEGEDGPRVVMSIQDITDRKREEAERAQLKAQLRHAQKLQSIGTLAGGIAHDFNNILSPIIGFTELSLMDTEPESKMHARLEKVMSAASRATELVKQILTFSRQAEQDRQTVRVQFIINEALNLLRASLPTTIDIRKKIDKECVPVLADATQIHQVLMNLCTNASHAIGENMGTIEVALDMVDVSPELATKGPHLHEGLYVRLTVRDTGEGMNRATLERIFDPFFTTKEAGRGTGLGLAVVHGIVINHGGEILVESEEGQGTTFQVFLPQASTEFEPQAPSDEETPKRQEKVLYVDDEEAIALMGKTVLELLGYQVKSMTGSAEALAEFQERPQEYDVVVTDQTMPRMTGTQLIREMRQIRPNLPVVLTSGYSQTVSPEYLGTMSIREFVMKPFKASEIDQAIQRALSAHQEVDSAALNEQN